MLNADPEKSLATGEVLGPLKAVNRDKRGLVLRATGIYFSRFRSGDQVDVGCIDSQTRKFQKISGTTVKDIRYPEPGILEVIVPGKLLPTDGIELFLLPSDSSGIAKIIRGKLLDLPRLGGSAAYRPINHTRALENFERVTEGLNATQIEALKFLGNNDFRGLVQGPPGTGKTHLLTALVHLALESGLRVGLASLAHSAIDNALARIIEGNVNNDWVARISSRREKIKIEPYRKHGLRPPVYRSFKDLENDEYGGKRLYAATMHAWCMTNSLPEIDILIIDEASQVPLYFYPFFEKISSRIIMFGDHKQLPPVIQLPKHDLPAEDVFSFEIEQGWYPMLETQYRMNSKIQHWSSHRFYDGRLQPHAKNRERDVLHGLPSTSGLLGAHQVNLVSHRGRANHHRNQHEASRVADLVSALQAEGKVPLSEIGIVTPHRAQAGAIYNELQQKLGLERSTHVLVDTVERFQGQEREAMIFSVGVESDNAKPGEKEFLGDGRRLNVAVTRARSRFYCFAPETLVDRTLARSGDGHLKSLIAWCDSSNTTKARNSKNTA